MIPERRRPDPLPMIHPVWEYQAEDALSAVYEEYKRAFQVPWVGVVSLAYAHYSAFFRAWWQGLEALVQTEAYVKAAMGVRAQVEEKAARLDPPAISGRLRSLGYSDRELQEIRDVIELISHGNFIQGPAVFAARLLLEGGHLSAAAGGRLANSGAHAPDIETPFVLMEPHHASTETRALYHDVMTRLDLPFVNTDYRAFSRWPSYFGMAWGDIREIVGTPAHEALAEEVHDAIFRAASELPNPAGLTPDALQQAAAGDASLEEVTDLTRLFTHLIPGLVTNVAFFRHQLLG